MQPFSKIYTPAQKYLYGPSVAYDTYRPAYEHAILYWEDTEPILEAAAADGVSISDSKEKLEWITNDNIGTYFPNAQCSINGTMEGDGSFANPYLIYNPQNWRYLDFLARLGKLSSSYYGMDRGTNVKLMADLTLSDRDGTFTTIGGNDHREVYNNGYAYNGNFDGNGHTITLYYVNRTYSDSLFGRVIGHTDYYENGEWHYWHATIKNLVVEGVMYGAGDLAAVAHEFSNGGTASNIIGNMTLVNTGAGGDTAVSGIVSTGNLSGNPEFHNIKVGGLFSAMGGNKGFEGITYMNDFWVSGTNLLIKNCYVNPVCEDIKVSTSNYVIVGNYKEEKVTIENTFFGQSILGIIPVDEETGETTNTQGISDENGLDALYATGYWADGNPTMPQAAFTVMPIGGKTFIYKEEESTVVDPETGEEQTVILPVQYELITPGETEDGTIWYRTDGGAWSTDIPTAAGAGKHTVECKIVGDCLHRDSDTVTVFSYITHEWTIPTGLTVTSVTMPYEDYGSFVSDTNAQLRVEWDDSIVNSNRFTMTIVTPDGQSGTYLEGAPVEHDAWYELGGDRPAVRFFVGLLGDDEEQIFENGTVNGAKYGDTVVITATGVIMIDGENIESPSCKGVDFAAGVSNTGKTFPVNEDGMSNDSGIKAEVIVLGDKAVVDCLASGGKAPYQYEVTYKKTSASKYTTAQAYKTNDSVSISLGAAVTYDVHVNVKDALGQVVGKDFTVQVCKPLVLNADISAETILLGQSLTVSAEASESTFILSFHSIFLVI